MKTKTHRTCEITKDGYIYASCQLQYLKNKYLVIVTEDPEDLFVSFDLKINNDELLDNLIKYFEFACLNRFTCNRQFSLEEVKENSGEEILFY